MTSRTEFGLPRGSLRRIEEWFQEDLSRVKVFSFSRNHSSRPAPLAFATPETVFVSDSLAPCAVAPIPLLVHEFAHVIQKRRAKSKFPRRSLSMPLPALEREAQNAALAFQAGRSCPQLSPDPSAAPRAWGPAGHYYTVYWVSRLAGVDHETAADYAFCAQLPDQVCELDATWCGEMFAGSAFLPCWFGIRNRILGDENYFDHLIYSIQGGIHCLNGRRASSEQERRVKILSNLHKDSFFNFSFGLGLHSLGDSFAHQNSEGILFTAPIGHAGQGWSLSTPCELGHEIDNAHLHPEIYAEYVLRLFETIVSVLKISLPEKRPYYGRQLAEMVQRVCTPVDDDSQIEAIRKVYPELNMVAGPEDDTVPWDTYQLRHPLTAADWMYGKALQLADAWCI